MRAVVLILALGMSAEAFAETATVSWEGLNLRSGPSQGSRRIKTIPRGAKVTLLGSTRNHYTLVEYKGKKAWVYDSKGSLSKEGSDEGEVEREKKESRASSGGSAKAGESDRAADKGEDKDGLLFSSPKKKDSSSAEKRSPAKEDHSSKGGFWRRIGDKLKFWKSRHKPSEKDAVEAATELNPVVDHGVEPPRDCIGGTGAWHNPEKPVSTEYPTENPLENPSAPAPANPSDNATDEAPGSTTGDPTVNPGDFAEDGSAGGRAGVDSGDGVEAGTGPEVGSGNVAGDQGFARMGSFRSVIANYDVRWQSSGDWHYGALKNSSALPGNRKIERERDVKSFMNGLNDTDRGAIRERGYIPINTKGWQYGNRQTIEAIMVAAANVAKNHPKAVDRPLLVDNISTRQGGSNGHLSHRNGLDADIVYYDKGEPADGDLGYRKFARGGSISSNFDFERNWSLLKEFAKINLDSRRRTGNDVVRYAISKTAIAKGIKAYAQRHRSETDSAVYQEALRLIDPFPGQKDSGVPDPDGHSTHFHVRFNKP